MSLIEKVCKDLGVEIGETWLGNDGTNYCILKDGTIKRSWKDSFSESHHIANTTWKDILTGEVKPVWQPERSETYYVPEPIHPIENDRYKWSYWDGHDNDKWYLENNFIFKTEEEAIAAANKILKIIKEAK